ncbi:hypothetical protein ACJMK2_041299 [Sinanodonta woodiana]|uniref:RNB domain-containing protein n=1 Tax=Sinanodonta woodiana TaxID=1069815 RepID=A0ABD3W703_SINWO
MDPDYLKIATTIKEASVDLTLDPNDQKALLRRCLAFEKLGLLERAMNDASGLDTDNTCTKEIITRLKSAKEKRTPHDYHVLKERGNVFYGAEQYDLALEAYKESIGLQDLDIAERAILHSNMAQCYLKQSNYEAAVTEATSALSLIPDLKKALYRRCLAFERLGLLEKAQADASRLDPDSVSTKEVISRLKLMFTEHAVKTYRSLREKGNALYAEGQYDQALDVFKEATRLQDLDDEKLVVLHNNMAQCYLKKGDFEAVTEEATYVLKLTPDDQKALYMRCLAYEHLGLLDKAFEDAERLDTDNASTKEITSRLIRLIADRKDYKTLREKGKAWYDAGQYKLAIEAYKEALDLQDLGDDKQGTLHSNIAQCYLKLRDYEAAVEEATSALSLIPNDQKALYRRCLAHENLGLLDKAMEDSSGLDPSRKSTKEIVLRLKTLAEDRENQEESTSETDESIEDSDLNQTLEMYEKNDPVKVQKLLENCEKHLNDKNTVEVVRCAITVFQGLDFLYTTKFEDRNFLFRGFDACTEIFRTTGEHFHALRSFYRGIPFNVEWNPQINHRRLADPLWFSVLESSSDHGEDLMYTMEDLSELSADFEKREKREKGTFWPAWFQIATDLFYFLEQAVTTGLLNFSQDLYLCCALRRGRGLLKLNDFSGVKRLCKSIINEKYDCMEAYEIWAKSLKNEGKFEYARKKADLALEFSKLELDQRRIRKLIHRIENASISNNTFEDCRDWIADTNALRHEQEMERIRLTAPHRKSTKRHRPKRKEKIQDFMSAGGHLIGGFSTNVDVSNFISERSKEADINQSAVPVIVEKADKTFAYAMIQKPEEWSDSDEDETVSDVSFEELQERPQIEENFYDISIHGTKESNTENDTDLLDLLRSGLQLSPRFVNKFMKKTRYRNFYEKDLHGSELERKARELGNKCKKCKIKIQSAHLAHCTPLDSTDPIKTITISGRAKAGQARSDDEVLVELIDEKGPSTSETKKYGKVWGTLKRYRNENVDHPLFLCALDPNENHLAIPLCKTVPKIELKRRYGDTKQFTVVKYRYDKERQELKFDKITDVTQDSRRSTLYIVVFITWNQNDIYPRGAVIDLLTSKGDIDSSLRILDIQHNVQTTYLPETIEETKTIINKYSTEETQGDVWSDRTHIIEAKVFTIDPPGSHDLDDALSIEYSDDVMKVGVHIADVSVYVPKGCCIDADAQRRTTSFYPGLRSKRGMLPEPLSIDLCSLLPGKRRPCLSVFFKFSKDANLIETPTVLKTIVCSSKQMTYQEVQEIIESGKSDDEEIARAIQHLYLLARQMRENRLHDSMYYLPIERNNDENDRDINEAHFLVEEFMILTNKTISEQLLKRFRNVTPLRRQQEPDREEIKQWFEKENEIVDTVLALQGKRIKEDKKPSFTSVSTSSNKLLTVQDWVWRVLTFEDNCKLDTLMTTAERYMRTDEMHPMQCLAYRGWISHQKNAEYVCSGLVSKPENGRHFSLDIYPYTHFTSPIRRYLDVITHRLVHSMIDETDSPYQSREVTELCTHINIVHKRQKAYEKRCEMLKLSLRLSTKPIMFNCFIDDVSDSCISLCIPSMKFKTKDSNKIPFNLLDPIKDPKIVKDPKFSYDLVRLEWRKRLFDARGYSSCITQRETKKTYKETLRIDPNCYGVSIPVHIWARALEHVLKSKMSDFKNVFANITPDVYKLPTSVETVRDVSTETHDGSVHPFTPFSITFTHGQIVKVQMAADMQNGILSPYLQLLFITKNVQFCLQHMKDPIRCLTQYATNSTRKKYSSIREYNETWLPLLQMESAMNSIRNEENFTIHNVPIKFRRRTGKFRLTIPYCYERNIDLQEYYNRLESSVNELDDSETNSFSASDWICVRLKLPQLDQENDNASFWIAHGEIKSVKKNEDKQRLTITFELHPQSPPLPRIVGQELFTIELLIKTDSHRRMEKCLKVLDTGLSDDDLALKMARFLKIPPLDENYLELTSSVDPEIDMADCPEITRKLPRNNTNQTNAIKRALTSRFSLIHGPPGTGKSYTGIKIIYLFNEINKMLEKKDGMKRQIIFCGPSNKSVDLVARLSKERLGSKCPKMVRIYGKTIENIDFPNHGRTMISKKSLRDTKPDESLRDISMHYLIRQDGKTYASDLKTFDQKFKRKDYKPTSEEFKEYKSLRYKARVEELKEHEIILCTTAVATNRILHTNANIWQLVIDEAGMCTEPECLAPIIVTRPKQVVLIGDHMQLQPIINSNHAAELGMSRSLFERYASSPKELAKHNIKYTFLNMQYRMNPGLCEFPSKMFYNNKLITEENDNRVLWKHGVWKPLSIWRHVFEPHILCHVEGEETALKASTDEGNEHSRSNLREIEKVVEVLRHLIKMEKIESWRIVILSQYNAQCSKLRDRLEMNGFHNVKVSTVVSSQGGEWDYVIFSTVRSLPAHLIEANPTLGWCKQNLGFITDQHQINVALTRARSGIIIIGNMNLLRCDRVWGDLIKHYENNGCILDADRFPPREQRMQRKRPRALKQRDC